MNRTVEDMKCPFCGKRDVEYGLALCASCHADIQYDVVKRDSVSPADAKRLEFYEDQGAKVDRNAATNNIIGLWFAKRRAEKLANEMEAFVKELAIRTNAKVDRRLMRGDTISIATFTRGDRSLDVQVYIPADPDAPTPDQTEFDVILLAPGRKLIHVVKELREITGAGLTDAKRKTDDAPTTVVRGVSLETAESIKAKLESVGASVELS